MRAGKSFKGPTECTPWIEPKELPKSVLDLPTHVTAQQARDCLGEEKFNTLSEDNVRFYERHGFEVTAHFNLPSGLPIWTMVRLPQEA
jgi:hypothetical protein